MDLYKIGSRGEGVRQIQKALHLLADGIFGKKSMKAWQKYLNSQLFKDDKQEEQKAEPKKEEPEIKAKPETANKARKATANKSRKAGSNK